MAYGWESSLRKLTKKPPSEGIITAVLDAMRSDMHDRPAALIMASAADTILQGAIAYTVGLTQPDQINAFFYHDGPFATFDNRIVGVKTLKLIGPATEMNLKVIKNVRNVFAHALSNVSFSSDEIANSCSRITLNDQNKVFVDNEEKRKIRFTFGFACDEVYRTFFHYISVNWIAGLPPRQILPQPNVAMSISFTTSSSVSYSIPLLHKNVLIPMAIILGVISISFAGAPASNGSTSSGDFSEIEATVHRLCDARSDDDGNRAALLTDLREYRPERWPCLTGYVNVEATSNAENQG